jgi:hypothetical protein
MAKEKKKRKRSKGTMVVNIVFDDYEIIGCLGDYVVNRLDFKTKYNGKTGTYDKIAKKKRVVVECTFHSNLAQCLSKIIKDVYERIDKKEIKEVEELIKLVEYQNKTMERVEAEVTKAIADHQKSKPPTKIPPLSKRKFNKSKSEEEKPKKKKKNGKKKNKA